VVKRAGPVKHPWSSTQVQYQERTIRVRSLPIMKILIIACLIAIVASLGSGLFYLVNDQGKSKHMANALTVRVGLSVLLFVLLLIAWSQGLIQPHGIGR
jgi:succinate dehydrogenase/fumarate reductase cytochrome b subunit